MELLRMLSLLPNHRMIVSTASERERLLEVIRIDEELSGKIEPAQIVVASINCLRSSPKRALVDDADLIQEYMLGGGIDAVSVIDAISVTCWK